MKKILASVLALMLLFSCTALAENNSYDVDEGVRITVTVPEGYAASDVVYYDGNMVVNYEPADFQAAACMALMVCPTEEFSDLGRLNDLSDEEIEQLAKDFCEDLSNPTVSYAETGLGTKLIVIDENNEEFSDDSVTIYTIYKGYVIQMFVVYADMQGTLGKEVTEADIARAIQFLTDMTFE